MIHRYRGSLIGLAVGDAIGATVEFEAPGTFTPVQDMIGGGPHDLNPGEWTDDTSMALCLAESLVECSGFDPDDQMNRYVQWYREGYLSAKTYCFDIGNTVREALVRFEQSGEPYAGSTHPMSAGNGSLMRLAPIPMYYATHPERALEYAAKSSQTTHGAREAVDGCRLLAALILGALNGVSKEDLCSAAYEPLANYWHKQPLSEKINEIRQGSYKIKQPPEIKGSGYVVESLEAALWAFYHSDSFKEGLLLAVNLGDDADTTGAIYGQLAGAYYGMDGIPEHWVSKIYMKDDIVDMAARLNRNTTSSKATP